MNRFDRIIGILLFLRSGQSVSAAELAQRFEVSSRTIYRDLELLSALGVPLYAERGREGGFRLLEGYFLPPLMFSTQEAISLLLGLTLLRSLQAQPFAAEMETAAKKLLAVVPDRLRAILLEADKRIGFEKLPADIFHPELAAPPAPEDTIPEVSEGQIVSLFLQAILDRCAMLMHYRSPYQAGPKTFTVEPLGLFWDRDHWYLSGQVAGQGEPPRLWRADRVLALKPSRPASHGPVDFDVREFLGHNWLKSAMARWQEDAPVKIRLSPAQAERLQQDWYYRHAGFEAEGEEHLLMTFGEDNRARVLELLRWLGPGAELVEPKAWRKVIRDELKQMLAKYESGDEQ